MGTSQSKNTGPIAYDVGQLEKMKQKVENKLRNGERAPFPLKLGDKDMERIGNVVEAYESSVQFYNQSTQNAIYIISILIRIMDVITTGLGDSKLEIEEIVRELEVVNKNGSVLDLKNAKVARFIDDVVKEFGAMVDTNASKIKDFNNILARALESDLAV